jgi:hypothetical protein
MCRPQELLSGCWPGGYYWTDLPSTNPPLCTVMPEMAVYRYAPNVVLLPDGSFLVIGGNGFNQIERYDGGQWHPCASLVKFSPTENPGGYGFHSTAVLLPSGKVLIGAGDPNIFGHLRWDYQIYAPWYIACPTLRPQILSVNNGVEQVRYGDTIPVTYQIEPGLAIGKVVLMRQSSVTHGANSEQRYIELDFTPSSEGANQLDVQMPARAPGHPAMQPGDVSGPPGWYMLYVVSDGRVPSEAKWVELKP